MSHYVGVDVGTGSARACIVNDSGHILAISSEPIRLWQPQTGYYEQSTSDIWRCIGLCIQRILAESKVDPDTIRGIGFDATCSLAVFDRHTNEPISVTGPSFDNVAGEDRNVILWLDHRASTETDVINATKHNLLRYVGGTMNIEMEIPKVLWLQNHMPPDLFDRCQFYDLADALTHLATTRETRSFCSAVCKQGYLPVGVDGTDKGWQEDFFRAIGLEQLTENDFARLGGVHGVNGTFLSAGEWVGGLSEQAAQELHLPAGIAVGSGVIDAYAGWIGTVGATVDLADTDDDVGAVATRTADAGSPVVSNIASSDISQATSRLAAVAGTSTCHLALSKDALFVPGVWGPYRDVVLPEYWMAEGGQSATGELIKHMLETHPAYAEADRLAQEQKTNIYDYLNQHLDSLVRKQRAPSRSFLARHLFFYGDLWGNRSPLANPSMAGAMIGMNSDKSVDSLALVYYVTLEFIAMQTRQIVERMNDNGHTITSIFMSGSQCQNPVLMELIATVCGMPVVIPEYVSAAVVHGAAMLGAKAASADPQKRNETEPLWQIMQRMSKPARAVHPRRDGSLTRLLNVKFRVFEEQMKTQQVYRKWVDDTVNGP